MISIIIPTLNEEAALTILIPYLKDCCLNKQFEIIIADAGSTDNTKAVAEKWGVKLIVSPIKGRAAQMNAGAKAASHEILYFVHADTIPPKTFYSDIIEAIKKGFEIGRYLTKFNSNKWLLKINAFVTRFDWFICYGGDQTLFVTQSLFKQLNGYNEQLQIMEEFDFVKRAREFARYKIFSKPALVSARKYEANSWFRVQIANATIVRLYKKGVSQKELVEKYRNMLSNSK